MREVVSISPDQKYTGVLSDCQGKYGKLQVWEGPTPLWRPKDFLCLTEPVRWLDNKRFALHNGSSYVIVDVVSRIYGLQPADSPSLDGIRMDAVSWAPWY